MSANPSRRVPHRDLSQAFWRDAALPFVESRRACQSRACYRPHHHPTFSIGAVDSGRSLFTGADVGPVALFPGTLVFVPPARVHACNPAAGTAWSYQMLHLDADWLRAVRREYADAAPTAPEPVRIVTDKRTYIRFCQLNALLFSENDPSDKEAALIEFIGDFDHESKYKPRPPRGLHAARIRQARDIPQRPSCVRAHPSGRSLARQAHPGAEDTPVRWQEDSRPQAGMTHTEQDLRIEAPSIPARLTEQIQPALDLLRAAPSASIALDELARLADLSRYQMIRAFRSVTGMTPHAWQLNQRINLAKERLRDGDDIAAVAQHLGFADQAHFQRVFKAHTGVTPGRFRA